MYAYLKINYELAVNDNFNNKKVLDTFVILLAIMLLCILAEMEAAKLPVSEPASETHYISDHITGNLIAISECAPEINIHSKPNETPKITFENRLKKILLTPEISTPVQVQTSESLESVIQETADIPPVQTTVSAEITLTPEDAADILPKQPDIPDVPDIPEVLPDESVTIPDNIQEPDVSEPNNQNFICSGFLCDASGKIIGCEDIRITDGVLCLPSDTACTGVGADALSSLSMQVYEIFIPANIITIEAGALDCLTELCYIEVHPDNPVYGSTEGSLYIK